MFSASLAQTGHAALTNCGVRFQLVCLPFQQLLKNTTETKMMEIDTIFRNRNNPSTCHIQICVLTLQLLSLLNYINSQYKVQSTQIHCKCNTWLNHIHQLTLNWEMREMTLICPNEHVKCISTSTANHFRLTLNLSWTEKYFRDLLVGLQFYLAM